MGQCMRLGSVTTCIPINHDARVVFSGPSQDFLVFGFMHQVCTQGLAGEYVLGKLSIALPLKNLAKAAFLA